MSLSHKNVSMSLSNLAAKHFVDAFAFVLASKFESVLKNRLVLFLLEDSLLLGLWSDIVHRCKLFGTWCVLITSMTIM